MRSDLEPVSDKP